MVYNVDRIIIWGAGLLRKIVKITNGGLEHILSEGARESSDGFIIDYTLDKNEDIIRVAGPTLYQTELFGNVYWFGYRFE